MEKMNFGNQKVIIKKKKKEYRKHCTWKLYMEACSECIEYSLPPPLLTKCL